MRSSFAQRGKTSGARGTRLSWSQLQIPLSRSGELRHSCRERYSRTSDALHSCWPSSHICLRHFSKSSTHSVVFSTCLFRSRRPSSPQGRISSVTFTSESRVRDTVYSSVQHRAAAFCSLFFTVVSCRLAGPVWELVWPVAGISFAVCRG
jgi:hypothetical protein